MSKIQELLKQPEFWLFYHTGGDDDGLDEDLLQKFCNSTFDEEGFPQYDPIKIQIDCSGGFSFELTINLDIARINAEFRVPNESAAYQIGWWDNERWHPFALQGAELVALHKTWETQPDLISITADQAFLLLAKFVGTGTSELEQIPDRKDTIREIWRRLGLQLSKAQLKELVSCTFLLPNDDDYDWTEHPELGAVFSGSYPCYSLRNEAHVDGKEGRFPFAQLQALIRSLVV